jgi:uncharacterized Zn finger protein (UPF0148 family)
MISLALKRKAAEEEAVERRVAEERERTMRALQDKVREEKHKTQQAAATEVEAVFLIWR